MDSKPSFVQILLIIWLSQFISLSVCQDEFLPVSIFQWRRSKGGISSKLPRAASTPRGYETFNDHSCDFTSSYFICYPSGSKPNVMVVPANNAPEAVSSIPTTDNVDRVDPQPVDAFKKLIANSKHQHQKMERIWDIRGEEQPAFIV